MHTRTLAFAVALLGYNAVAQPIVDPSIQPKLLAKGTVNIMVTLKNGITDPLNAIETMAFADRGKKISHLVQKLQTHAKTSQRSIDDLLSADAKKKKAFKADRQFWITNERLIVGATPELVKKLSQNEEISKIMQEIVLPLPEIKIISVENTTMNKIASINPPEWGVSMVSAPSVWDIGVTGHNVVIGTIDTGVMVNHSALQANWRADYGWYDPTANSATPYDDLGHGTHTMGTIVGLNGIGVAPGAKFITCKACTSAGCSSSDLLACAQFMACPTTPDGLNSDCAMAPRLVSNSWGGGQGATWFNPAIQVWQKSGIIPVFSIGNSGPECNTANSPGDNSTVIAVGATDVTDALASFSSKGPSVGGLLKPEISAPGVNVRSAWYTGTSSFAYLSGTSMAAPHVAGVIALLLSKCPGQTYNMIKALLTTTTDKATLKATGYTCGGTKDTTFPNNQYGYGRINALSAFQNVVPAQPRR